MRGQAKCALRASAALCSSKPAHALGQPLRTTPPPASTTATVRGGIPTPGKCTTTVALPAVAQWTWSTPATWTISPVVPRRSMIRSNTACSTSSSLRTNTPPRSQLTLPWINMVRAALKSLGVAAIADFVLFTSSRSEAVRSSMALRPLTTVVMLSSVPKSPAVLSSTQHRRMRGFLLSMGCGTPGARSTPPRTTGIGNARGIGAQTMRRHLSIKRPSTKVAIGQPGIRPDVGSLLPPMASSTLMRRALFAMQSIGPPMAGCTPQSRSSSAKRSKGTLS